MPVRDRYVPTWAWWVILPTLFLLGIVTTIAIVKAQDITAALYSAAINITNSGINRENYAAAANISGSALIDGNFIEADALNAVVLKGSELIPSMPPSNRIQVEGLVVEESGVFTEYTTEAQSATTNDIPLLPTVPATGDAVYFGFDNPARILTVDVGTASGHDLALTWQYNATSGFTALTNVDDRTNAFTVLGRRTVSWDMPNSATPWVSSAVTGSAVTAFWARAVVGDVEAAGTQPLGDRAFYENGHWWVWDDSLSAQEQEQYTLYLGGVDIVDHHQIFPGDDGIVTPDAAALELGDIYGLLIDARLSFGATGSTVCIVCKGSDFRVYIADTDTVTLEATGSGGVTLSITDITLPATGAQSVVIGSDGTTLTFSVEGFGATTGAAQNVTDNADDWEWGTNGAVVYFESIIKQPTDPTDASVFEDEGEWDTGTHSGTDAQVGDPESHYRRVANTSAGEDGFSINQASIDNASAFIRMGTYAGPNEAEPWFTFRDMVIDSGTVLNSAFIEVTPDTSDAGTDTALIIQAVDSCDASPPTSSAEFNALDLTTAAVTWSVPGFTANTALDTTDFAPVIQELIDDCGGLNGDIVIVMTNVNATVENKRVYSALTGGSPSIAGNRDIRYPTLKLSVIDFTNDDFIQLANESGPPTGWAAIGSCTVNTSTNQAHTGRASITQIGSGSAARTCQLRAPTFEAAPGQVWSATTWVVRCCDSTTNDVTSTIRINWHQTGVGVIGTETSSVTWPAVGAVSEAFLQQSVNNRTAPANTTHVELELELDCNGTCSSASTRLYWDTVSMCQACTVAPDVGSDQNRLASTGEFGDLGTDGTWTSPALSLTATNAQSSSVTWVPLAPVNTTLTVETSVDNQVSWQTPTNGGAIPNLGTGDVSGTDVYLRFTMAATGADVGTLTPYVSDASLLVEDLGEADLQYELNTTPGVTIADRSGNGNTGTMSYPVPLTGINVSMGALRPLQRVPSQELALPVPGIAGPASGSAVDERMFETAGTGINLPFGGVINDAATQGQIPVQLLWAILAMLVILLAGAGAFIAGSALAAVVIMAVGLGVAALISIGMPGWTVFIMLPVDLAIVMLWRRVLGT